MAFRLSLPCRLYRDMLAQAQQELPNECCGLLGGTLVDGVGRVTSRYPLVNAAASPIAYFAEGYELLQKSKLLRWRKQEMLAIYHSHPTTAPIPSSRDMADANYSDAIYLIISLAQPEPVMRGWWLTSSTYEPAEWICTEDDTMTNPFLLSDRLYLRPLEREDAATLARWLNDPEVNSTLLHNYPLSVLAEQTYLEELSKDRSRITLGIVVREGNQFIGVAGLQDQHERDRHATFGIVIGEKAQWGKGYGTEATQMIVAHAFQSMNLNRVVLHVLSENTRAVRAYETAGFKREGVFRQHQFREGRYQDIVVMGLLRDEWRPKKL